MMAGAAAPDGSPVDLYLRLPARLDLAAAIDRRLKAGSQILDLGCGTGRIAEQLCQMGHIVTAVDNEPAMLAHLRLSEPILADIATMRLGRRFDAVLLTSHLVNHPDPATVRALLRTVRVHLRAGGFAVIERYPPGWVATCTERSVERDGVRFHLRDIERTDDGVLSAKMIYEFDGKRLEQPFRAREFDESLIAAWRARIMLID